MTSQNTQLDFTVAICTYNGADRIPDVLDCLRWQLKTDAIKWEVIVVDNNSTDNTADVVQQYQTHWPALRYTFEAKQGAGYARQRAVNIARSPIIGFLDDDNLPSMLWVYEAYTFAQAYPDAGVIGSRIKGLFPCELPPDFERIAQFLALIDRGERPLFYQPEKKVLPPGAGMVVRREAWLQNVPENPVLSGRAGKSMLTGEDLEVVLHIQQAGWQVWYNPAMRLGHKISAHRLQRSYLVNLMRGIGLSRHRTRMLSVAAWKRPLMFFAYTLNDIRKILRHLCVYRQKIWTDTVTASEMTLYCYSLISPYFLWQKQLNELFSNCFQKTSEPMISVNDFQV